MTTLLCSLAPAAEPIVVAADGSGQFTSVQAALDSIPKPNAERRVILIKPGIYKELIKLGKDLPLITFRGGDEDPSKTVLTYDLYASRKVDGKEVGTSGSASTRIDGADFIAENITFENSAGEVGQAVALRITGDRGVYRNCRFLGWQDTLYPNGGRQYFVDSHIEGRVDFIFGRSTAVFERCEIVSKNGGYVTAASTSADQKFGYVFLDCNLISPDKTPAYLGRPWRPDAAVAFIRCKLGEHIHPDGWNNWGKVENEKTARYVEYGNAGPGADRSRRVAWSKMLTDEEAKAYTIQNVLGGDDQWDPTNNIRPSSR